MTCKFLLSWTFRISFALAAFARPASGFPENIRKGYASCSSCHVSPSGGGVLTDYGKATAGEFTTWGQDDSPRNSDKIDRELLFGGDVRYLAYRSEQAGVAHSDQFVMQSDVEAAAVFGDVTFDASVGVDRNGDPLTRRHYIIVRDIVPGLSARAGKFMPAFGINHPDHTIVTKQAFSFGNGVEPYGAELSYGGDYGEVFVSRFIGAKAAVTMDQSGYQIPAADDEGYAAKATYFASSKAAIGVSLAERGHSVLERSYGLNALIGADSIYGLAEIVQKSGWRGSAIVGWLPWQGVHLRGSYEYANQMQIIGIGSIWLPYPHVEISGQLKRQFSASGDTVLALMMLHYYL